MLQALLQLPMTSRERRKQRRRDENNARKEAIRNAQLSAAPLPQISPSHSSKGLDFADSGIPPKLLAYVNSGRSFEDLKAALSSMSDAEPTSKAILPSTGHTERNRKNAQHSTGPKTTEGKSESSKNAFRHGLASNKFLVLPWENMDEFDELLDNLRAEHQPATQTEALLIEKMAEHFWLSQRALRLQDMCFHRDVPICDQPKELALYLRYQATHDRAFHKCLAVLAKLRAEQRKIEGGFVSQKRQEAAEVRRQEIHAARMAGLTSNKSSKEQRGEPLTPSPATAPVASALIQPEQPSSVPPQHTEASASVFSKAA